MQRTSMFYDPSMCRFVSVFIDARFTLPMPRRHSLNMYKLHGPGFCAHERAANYFYDRTLLQQRQYPAPPLRFTDDNERR